MMDVIIMMNDHYMIIHHDHYNEIVVIPIMIVHSCAHQHIEALSVVC